MIANSGISGSFQGLPYLNWQITKHISSAFTGGTPSTHGAFGTTPTYEIWTVTGVIYIQGIIGVCNTALVGAATLEVGIVGITSLLIGIETDVSATININNVWGVVDDNNFGGSFDSIFRDNGVIINGTATNLIETSGTANITAGQLDYYMVWTPLSSGASVVDSGALS